MRRAIPGPPAFRERRRGWSASSFAALDFETTGLDFARDRIVSFGVVPIDRASLCEEGGCYGLVDPGPVPVSPVSLAIHGLGPEELREAMPASAAREALREALGGRFLITWNGLIEASFLAVLFHTSTRPWLRRAIDVRPLVLALRGPDAATWTLSDAAARFGVPVTAPHHAYDDALVAARLFLATALELGDTGRLRSTRDALRIGRPRGAGVRRLFVAR